MSVSFVTIHHSSEEGVGNFAEFYKKLLNFREYYNIAPIEKVIYGTSCKSSRWIGDQEGTFIIELAIDEDKDRCRRATEKTSDWTFYVKDIQRAEERLKFMNVTYQLQGLEGSEQILRLLDPSGYCLTLTNKISPASTKVHVPLDTNFDAQIAAHSRFNISRMGNFKIGQETAPLKRIAVLTSGGDAPGMNAAFRAVVRVALYRNCEVYAIYDGYQGAINGGDSIRQVFWNDVTGIVGKGGTIIRTARCKEFQTWEGRLKAAYNLILRGIDGLAVIGGDGSLTGADLFRKEWGALVSELVTKGKISNEVADRHRHLSLVGMVGSIDNDMCGTDFTIGAASALHRIVEAMDAVSNTAQSHQRAFIIEVMGRHCGWLALMASIATGADWLFMPEAPAEYEDWEKVMCETLRRQRAIGRRQTILIIAEGAIDKNCQPIKSDYVKEVIERELKVDVRVTVLGHVQRGGSACAFDRYMATIVGADAVDALLDDGPDRSAKVIGISENHLVRIDLQTAVAQTRSIAAAIKEKNFKYVMDMRGHDFVEAYKTFMATALIAPLSDHSRDLTKGQFRLAIVHTGAPSCGMNMATRIATRVAIDRGHEVLGIYNGFSGLMNGEVKPLLRITVDEWANLGGSELGTNRSLPSEDFGLVAYRLQQYQIDGLLIIGGYEAFSSILQLCQARKNYPAFCLPMICLPATISNNVPGTEYSIGSDTALNVIVESCDRIKQSATSSRKRAFVVEVQGGMSGYLATVAGIACGCTRCYIPEEGITITELCKDIGYLIRSSKDKVEGRIMLRNEKVNDLYTTEFITALFNKEGEGYFDCRHVVLGHLQQGGAPSPLDRVRASRLAALCIDFLEGQAKKNDAEKMVHRAGGGFPTNIYKDTNESAVIIGLKGTSIVFTPVVDLLSETNTELRRPKKQWWSELRPLLKILANYEALQYREEDSASLI